MLGVVLIACFWANVFFGSVGIPFSVVLDVFAGNTAANEPFSTILLSSRLPQAVTALAAGAALAVSGLMLQTLFNNPLAAPSILGISSGSGLGVAVVLLFLGGSLSSLGFFGHFAVVIGALVGAMAVLGVIILFSVKIKSNVMLLVVGIMIGYIATSLVTLMSFYAESNGVVSYVIWGMGDFSGVTSGNLAYFLVFIGCGLLLSILLIKPLNALLLGEKYSRNLGVNIRRTRIVVIFATGVLTAVVTAFCGPVAFIGLAVPHIARLIFGTSNHFLLVPATILLGSIIALVCNLCTVVFTSGTVIPLNVITPMMGAPVIIYVIVNKKNLAYFN